MPLKLASTKECSSMPPQTDEMFGCISNLRSRQSKAIDARSLLRHLRARFQRRAVRLVELDLPLA